MRIQAGDRARDRAEIHRLRCEVLDVIVELVDLPRQGDEIRRREHDVADRSQHLRTTPANSTC